MNLFLRPSKVLSHQSGSLKKISPLATIMWQLTTKELCGQGLLCVTDLAVLERWCVAYEFWRRAVKNIAIQGNTITGAMGGRVKNPELTAKKNRSPR